MKFHSVKCRSCGDYIFTVFPALSVTSVPPILYYI